MVELPERMNPTVAAIFARHERDADDWRRPHLGASIIGRECVRSLWYSFRWLNPPGGISMRPVLGFDGRLLRLFERGHREEAWIVEELKALEWEVHDVDENGDQWRVSYLGGHFSGSSDGALLGVPEARKTWHLLEVKTSNAKRFAELRRDGVKVWSSEHYTQMQIYMHGLGLTRALYVCVCKNDDHIHVERVEYDEAFALRVIEKADAVVFSAEPLTRISDDPTWWKCKFCAYRPACHLSDPSNIERNCRTCASSTPLTDGTWRCDHHGIPLDGDAQRAGCDAHLFIPALLPWSASDFDKEARAVYYDKSPEVRVVDTGGKLEEVYVL